MRLNSGLAIGLVELLKPSVAEGLDHVLSIALRFTVVEIVAEVDSQVRESGPGAPGIEILAGLCMDCPQGFTGLGVPSRRFSWLICLPLQSHCELRWTKRLERIYVGRM